MTDEGFVNPQELMTRIGIQEGMQVADFGSGSGEIAIMIANLVGETGRVTALDVLPSALESVSAKAKRLDLKNVTSVRANLEVLGSSTLGDNSQDVVFLANILWQTSKKKEVLEEASRIVKSGGKISSVEWNKNENPAGPPTAMRIGAEELRALMERVGLAFVETFPAGGFHYGLLMKKP
ncbi:MAG: methyltransferase domain-containing protein [Patescibacteria group bacterium]